MFLKDNKNTLVAVKSELPSLYNKYEGENLSFTIVAFLLG